MVLFIDNDCLIPVSFNDKIAQKNCDQLFNLFVVIKFYKVSHCSFFYRRTAFSVPCSLVITCWERADRLALLCVMFACVSVTLRSSVVLDCIYSWSLSFIVFSLKRRIMLLSILL